MVLVILATAFLEAVMINIAVLVSGGGTNLQALIDYEQSHMDCPYKIAVVISDHKKAYALERAKIASIPTALVSPYSLIGRDKALIATKEEKQLLVSNAILKTCKEYKITAVILAGFISIISQDLIDTYKDRMINLHPALLPKFGGVGMWGNNVHKAVLAAGEKESGCTVHIVTGAVDTGRILVQKRVPVLFNDTVDTLYARIAPEEHKAIVEGAIILCKELEAAI